MPWEEHFMKHGALANLDVWALADAHVISMSVMLTSTIMPTSFTTFRLQCEAAMCGCRLAVRFHCGVSA